MIAVSSYDLGNGVLIGDVVVWAEGEAVLLANFTPAFPPLMGPATTVAKEKAVKRKSFIFRSVVSCFVRMIRCAFFSSHGIPSKGVSATNRSYEYITLHIVTLHVTHLFRSIVAFHPYVWVLS